MPINDGDHFVRTDEAVGVRLRADLALEGIPVVDEIVREVEAGSAHLLTRNELAEFVEWLVTDEGSAIDFGLDTIEINSVVFDFLQHGTFRASSKAFAADVAKRFFIHKGYEK